MGRQCRTWVISGEARGEHIPSGLPPMSGHGRGAPARPLSATSCREQMQQPAWANDRVIRSPRRRGASSIGGTSSPIAFAALRLITSSNLVGCSTANSPGFAPLRILSTYIASRWNDSFEVGPVGHGAARFGEFGPSRNSGNTLQCCKFNDPLPMLHDQPIRQDDHCFGARGTYALERRLDFGDRPHLSIGKPRYRAVRRPARILSARVAPPDAMDWTISPRA